MRVGLVQINSSFSGQHYFPYSAGILQAYAMKHLRDQGRYEFLLPIYKRIPVVEAAAHLREAQIACFSVYSWNVRLSLAVAEALKRQNPETLIVFGGPQVPKYDRPWEAEEFLRNNPFVDLAVHGMGKGERSFLAVLEHGLSGNREAIPSASFLEAGDRFFQTSETPGFKGDELAKEVPSPYASGVFDQLMAANPDEQWIGLWETNRNCPFSCTFCGWGELETKPVVWDMEHVCRDIDWFSDRKLGYVFCADANFGLLPRDVEIARYIARKKQESGYPTGLNVQDTKNVKHRALEVRKILRDAFSSPVVISLQSVAPQVLKNIRRDNISLADFFDIQRVFAAEGIRTMTDLILGLPGETYDSWADGIAAVIGGGQHNRIQFQNLSVVPDAELSHPVHIERYGLKTVWSKIVNIHGLVETDEVPEMQELVIATATMPKEDWVRARALGWMSGLLHFDKLLQVPLVLAHELGGVSYRELLEVFSSGKLDAESFPVLTGIRQFFEAKARDMQLGGSDYCHAPEWLNIYWPPDEYVLIDLVVGGKLAAFYEEANRALRGLVRGMEPSILDDALRLNQALLKLPFQNGVCELELGWNVWETYRSVLVGERIPITAGSHRCRIDRTRERWDSWEKWYREMVWWCNRSGAYLRGAESLGGVPAGHH